MFVIRYSLGPILRHVAVEPVHAIDVVDCDGPEELDGDSIGVNGELMA
jgi:hypothetical protein